MLPIDTNVFPEKNGVYVVGGAIRDLLCDRTSLDYDLAVTTAPDKFAKLLAANTGGKVIYLSKLWPHTAISKICFILRSQSRRCPWTAS